MYFCKELDSKYALWDKRQNQLYYISTYIIRGKQNYHRCLTDKI